MIDLLPKVLKSLEDVGQQESFLKFMGLIASGTFPLHNICYLLFLDIVGVISFILVTFRSLKKILTEVLHYWSIQLLFVGFLVEYVS
jgi:hypothetical protein